MTTKLFPVIFIISFLSSCAVAHHVQVGDIDDRYPVKRFEIKLSEDGVDIKQLGHIARLAAKSKAQVDFLRQVEGIISMFQHGPTTGRKVFNDVYAEDLIDRILASCPSGDVSGLYSIRETREYPIVSGEIVKVVGYCRIAGESI